MAKVLTELPLDLLLKVTCLLDIVDLLSLSRVSRVLYEISSLRSVWHHFACRYIERHYGSVQPEEGPIETLSTSSLRKWIITRLHADYLWQIPKLPRPPRWGRQIMKLGCAKLVPGGRWLLVGLATGEVVFYDLMNFGLDSEPKVLISNNGSESPPSPKHSVDFMDISFSYSKSGDFEFVLAITGHPTAIRRKRSIIHIYKVTLEVEGEAKTLSAKHLNSVSSEGGNCIRDIAIAGPLLARSSTLAGNSFTIIEIFQWEKCSETHMVRSVIHLARHFAHISFKVLLLGETRILVIEPQNIRIYDIPPFSPSSPSSLSEFERESNPTWSFHLETVPTLQCLGTSQLYRDEQTGHFRIVVSSQTAIWGLIIPDNSNGGEPRGIRLMDSRHYEQVLLDPSRVVLALGLQKGYACYSNRRGIRFGWDWDRAMTLAEPEEPAASDSLGYVCSEDDGDTYECYQRILLDEETGCVLLVRPCLWGPDSSVSMVAYF